MLITTQRRLTRFYLPHRNRAEHWSGCAARSPGKLHSAASPPWRGSQSRHCEAPPGTSPAGRPRREVHSGHSGAQISQADTDPEHHTKREPEAAKCPDRTPPVDGTMQPFISARTKGSMARKSVTVKGDTEWSHHPGTAPACLGTCGSSLCSHPHPWFPQSGGSVR